MNHLNLDDQMLSYFFETTAQPQHPSTMPQHPHPQHMNSYICPQDVTSKSEDGSDGHSVKSENDTRSNSFDTTASGTPSPSQKKKRKSWGQVLPIPTTNLPPRKRAKTDAEKEQRKYERVQRNRAAAHQSRMRKQEEKDRLEAENNRLKQDCQSFKDEIARLSDELAHLRQQMGQPTRPNDLSREPSLTLSSPNASSPESEIFTPPMSPEASRPMESLQTSTSHSAAMCSPQWMLDSQVLPPKERQQPYMALHRSEVPPQMLFFPPQ